MAGVYEIARQAKIKEDTVKEIFAAIRKLVKQDKVTIKNFGTFRLLERKSRSFSTPLVGKDGEGKVKFEVPAHLSLAFRASPDMKMLPLPKKASEKRTGSKLGKKKTKK